VEKRLSDDGAGQCVGELIDQAMDLTVRFLSDRAELGASAAFVLNRVCREGPIRLTLLATKEGVSQPSMTQLIQRLERQGLVSRLADPDDGRAALIGITDHGREVLDDRKRLRRDRLTELLATLTPEETHALWLSAQVAYPILQQLAANADSSDPATTEVHRHDTASRLAEGIR
jgi:DNA-binding MarR family transcriptional regulator